MMEDKIQKLFSDEALLKEFLSQKDIEKCKKFFRKSEYKNIKRRT